MGAAVNQEFLEELTDFGNRLSQPPSSTPELLKLLDEVVLLLSKIGQAPSQLVQDALLATMNALISDKLMGSSDADVLITVAACLNEIMRISAPNAPYDDEKMKEIFELIVSSFDKLNYPPGPVYDKAVLILESVARLRSCVMMLDLDCDLLITKMFELFQRHISPNHPHSVFLAMEKIMSVMVKESDSLSMELVMVLVESMRKENQITSPEAFKLGAKVVEECLEKLKPYIMEAITSLNCCLEDYAPIISSICETEHNAMKDLILDSTEHAPLKTTECYSEDSGGNLGTSSKGRGKVNSHNSDKQNQNSTTECYSEDSGGNLGTSSKGRGKVNSHNSDKQNQNSTGKVKTSRGNPYGHVKKSEKAISIMEDGHSTRETKEAADLDNKKTHQPTSLGGSSDKKGKPSKKGVSGGSGKKSTTSLSRKDKILTNDNSRSQKKRAASDDDVFETPHGIKTYKEDLIGSRIKVWWPLDRRYYEGNISSFDASTKKHKVDYDDGDTEVLNLRTEQWEFVGDETSNDIDLFVDKKTPQPRSKLIKRDASTTTSSTKETKTNTIKGEVMLDNGAEADDEKVKMAEILSETKRLRLSDGHKS